MRDERPQNSGRFVRLLASYREIAPICHELHLAPLLSGSLAAFAYTRDRTMRVNDIDLACPEAAFPQLGRALAVREIAFEVQDWHVLRARRDDLKIEFDALEYWFAGLPTDHDTLSIDGCRLNIGESLLPAYALSARACSNGSAARHRQPRQARGYRRKVQGALPLVIVIG